MCTRAENLYEGRKNVRRYKVCTKRNMRAKVQNVYLRGKSVRMENMYEGRKSAHEGKKRVRR